MSRTLAGHSPRRLAGSRKQPEGSVPLKIAQISPLFESVPPKLYGGTERVVSYLTEELVRQGHDVTLFASGDSVTSARLVPCSEKSLRLDDTCRDRLAHQMVLLHEVFARANRFDLLHFHIDYLHYPFSERQPVPHLTTLHGRLDLPDLVPVYRTFENVPVVSISAAQREPLPWLNWQATVPHGLPLGLHAPRREAGRYLAFLGRISKEKRVDRAIEIAKRVGMPLKIAAKIDKSDRDYYEREIAHLLDHPLVEYIGEIGEAEKTDFLGNAHALIFPVDWPEPFGLVMIEAMACGTPSIAWCCGSIPEVIDEGVSGFIVDSIDQAVAAVERAGTLSRAGVRRRFEERFSVERMVRDYVAVYEELVEGAVVAAPAKEGRWKTLFASKTITTS
jgi:glycosyltransferase involved in cell wall biosynthesis